MMAKTLDEARISTREQRKKLPVGVHWRGIDPDVHLGYRKGKRGGKWLVRWRAGNGYEQRTFATADDHVSEGTLDFRAAQREALRLVKVERRKARMAAAGPLLNVRHAVESYIAVRDARESGRRGRPIRSDATGKLLRYVIGKAAKGKRKAVKASPLADLALHELKESDLLDWRARLPESLKASSKQRIINYFKAALNEAFATHRSRLPPSLPAIIKYGLRVVDDGIDGSVEVARDNQILSDAEVVRLVVAAREIDAEQDWDGDLFRLVVLLAATGARFSQIVRMRVGDVQEQARRVFMPVSRKGRGRRSGGTPIPVGADVLEALRPAVKGRPSEAPLLLRPNSERVAGGIRWQRVGRCPWEVPSDMKRSWTLIRERARMPEVIPYAFRHSSIVRGIRVNQPIRLVAALHDTSVVMIERHYARYIADGLEELAARSVIPIIAPAADQSGCAGGDDLEDAA